MYSVGIVHLLDDIETKRHEFVEWMKKYLKASLVEGRYEKQLRKSLESEFTIDLAVCWIKFSQARLNPIEASFAELFPF